MAEKNLCTEDRSIEITQVEKKKRIKLKKMNRTLQYCGALPSHLNICIESTKKELERKQGRKIFETSWLKLPNTDGKQQTNIQEEEYIQTKLSK